MEDNIAQKISETLIKRNKSALAQAHSYQKVTEWALLLLIFLLPLFFLPWTREVLELNKQTLLVILTSIALMAWLGGLVVEKKIFFRSGYLNFLPFLFLASVFVSSLLSLAKYPSWVGQLSSEYTSFLTIAAFILLFYVLANHSQSAAFLKHAFFALLSSSALTGLIGLFSLFQWYLFPFAFAQRPGFNTVGSLNALAVFMTIVMIFGLGLWFVSTEDKEDMLASGKKGTLMKIFIILNTVVSVILALAIDFWGLWALHIVGIITLFAFALVQKKDFFAKSTRLSLGILILIISILFLFIQSPLRFNFPRPISLSAKTSMQIARSVWSEGATRTLFGSGPGTFVLDYTKFKPQSINNTIVWNRSFPQSKSFFLTLLATLGVVSGVVFVLFLVIIALKALSRLLREQEQESWKFTYVLGVSWLTAAVSMFLHSTNITLHFLFWVFSGLLAGQIFTKTRESNFAKSPRLGFVFSFLFIFLAVGVITTFFIAAKRYASEARFAEAVNLSRNQAPAEQVIQKIGEAISYHSLSDIYYRNLSYALLLRLRDVLKLPEGATQFTPEQTKAAQQLVSASTNSVARATALAPNDVLNWYVTGLVYRELMPLVRDANSASVTAYTKASTLDPVNPIYPLSIGRIHLITADRARALKSSENKDIAAQAVEVEKKSLEEAEKAFNQAVSLKQDYGPAHYYLAAVYERQGKVKDAIGKLEILRSASPLDIGVGFQLSQLYIRDKNYDAAQKELERLVGLRENYSNARWYLSFVYEQKGNVKGAIEQVQKVLDLNAENKAVKDRLDALKAGKKTGTGLQPVEEGEELEEKFSDEEETTEDGE